jgi:hypothetical protein
MHGINRNAKRKLEAVEIYLLKLFIVIDRWFLFFYKIAWNIELPYKL